MYTSCLELFQQFFPARLVAIVRVVDDHLSTLRREKVPNLTLYSIFDTSPQSFGFF